MHGTIRIARRVDESTWRALVDREPRANVFHTPEMYQVFERARGHRPNLWAASDADGSPLAMLLPVEITLFGGVLRSWTSRAVAYGGLLSVDHPLAERSVRALLSAYREENRGRMLLTELRHVSDAADLRPTLQAAGFAHEGHLNFLIHLDRPEADLWSGLSKSAQQRVRGAERRGVQVEEITEEFGGDEVYRLMEGVYRRVGVPLPDRSLFRAALSILRPRGMVLVLTARVEGRAIGARFLLLHRDRMLDWYAGSDRAFSSYSPNELLVWQALRWGQERGFKVFDFGGAGRPGERYGVREFKAKFGGELIDLGRDVLVQAPLRLRLSRSGYAVFRRFLWGGARAGQGAKGALPTDDPRIASGDRHAAREAGR